MTDQQLAAVQWTHQSSGNLILEAVAGSGKTFTIIEMLIAINHHFPQARCALMSFNDKQQLEAMREAITEARDLLLSLEHEGNQKGTRCISYGSHCSEPHKESCNMLSALAKLVS